MSARPPCRIWLVPSYHRPREPIPLRKPTTLAARIAASLLWTRSSTTSPPKYALSEKFYAAVRRESIEPECPVWVKPGSGTPAPECLLLGVERTSIEDRLTSESSQERKSAVPKLTPQFGTSLPVVGAVHRIKSGSSPLWPRLSVDG